MKTARNIAALTLGLMLLAVPAAEAQKIDKEFGIGGTIGSPSSIDFKWWASDLFGLNAGVGAHYFGAQVLAYVDFEFNVAHWRLGGRAPARLYIGPSVSIGHAFKDHRYGYKKRNGALTYGGVGAVFGFEVDFWFPLGIFIELRPEVGMFGYAGTFDMGGHVGARYRF